MNEDGRNTGTRGVLVKVFNVSLASGEGVLWQLFTVDRRHPALGCCAARVTAVLGAAGTAITLNKMLHSKGVGCFLSGTGAGTDCQDGVFSPVW
jgi:hypothetical protein